MWSSATATSPTTAASTSRTWCRGATRSTSRATTCSSIATSPRAGASSSRHGPRRGAHRTKADGRSDAPTSQIVRTGAVFAFQARRAYQFAMADREPALLGPSRDDRIQADPATRHPTPPPGRPPMPTRLRRDSVYVVGFWYRLVAAVIDLAVVIPAALIIALIAGRITGLHMPTNLHLLDIDLWIDLVLATDPALVMALVLFSAIGLVYLLVFHIVVGRTLGMRLLHIKVIDVYGDP